MILRLEGDLAGQRLHVLAGLQSVFFVFKGSSSTSPMSPPGTFCTRWSLVYPPYDYVTVLAVPPSCGFLWESFAIIVFPKGAVEVAVGEVMATRLE